MQVDKGKIPLQVIQIFTPHLSLVMLEICIPANDARFKGYCDKKTQIIMRLLLDRF